MKQWKAAEISALDINMTENGRRLPWHEGYLVVETPCFDLVKFVPGHGSIDCGGNNNQNGGEDQGSKGPGETSSTGDTNAWS